MAAEIKKINFSRHLGFFEQFFSTKFASHQQQINAIRKLKK
jgi:hypothetical protein